MAAPLERNVPDVPTSTEPAGIPASLREAARDAAVYGRATDKKTFAALLLAPILIALTMRIATVDAARPVLLRFFRPSSITLLTQWYFLFGQQFLFMFVIPTLCIKFVYREPLRDYGHQIRPVAKLWPLIVVFLAIMLPITLLASREISFRSYYPLYPGSFRGWIPFLEFEAGALLLFFSQESFFRGFVIESLAPRLGYTAVLVSTALYGVAHYTKPLPEQLGAFFVGNLLGYIGLRYRTCYFGVIVHYGVAFSMDAMLVVPRLLHGQG